MLFLSPYDRLAAVDYAHQWAYGRNPNYYDYEMIGGDCTNFASQCLFAGCQTMDYTPTFGWYYMDANRKAPAWTGVRYLDQYLTRSRLSPGPIGREVTLQELMPGDILQLSFDGQSYQHSPIVVAIGKKTVTVQNIYVAAHSADSDNRPLSTYSFQAVRCLHIIGCYQNKK